MSAIVPNSAPLPNFYTDQLAWLLTGDEWKLLTYAVRRIFGFEKGRQTKQAPISLSTFEEGIWIIDPDTGEPKQVAHGCGLTKPVISTGLKNLERYGVLESGEITNDGRLWGLQMDEGKIDLDGLLARREQKKAKTRKRVAKAAKASSEKRKMEAGTWDVPPNITEIIVALVRGTYPQGYAGRTARGTLDVPIESKEKATRKQDSTPPQADGEESALIPWQPANIFEFVLHAMYGVQYMPKMKLNKRHQGHTNAVTGAINALQPKPTLAEVQAAYKAHELAKPRDVDAWCGVVMRYRETHTPDQDQEAQAVEAQAAAVVAAFTQPDTAAQQALSEILGA